METMGDSKDNSGSLAARIPDSKTKKTQHECEEDKSGREQNLDWNPR